MPRLIQQQHEKVAEQGKGAEESSMAAAQEGRAGEQGKAARQGRGAKAGSTGQGIRAGQQGRAAGEIQLVNGRRGANICQKICKVCHEFVNIGQQYICKRPQKGKHL